MQLGYAAPSHVRQTLTELGRTEDVRFSPDNRRLAVLGFHKNVIAVFDIDITAARDGKIINLTDVAEISSPQLKSPHGIDFIDDDTVVIANRDGKVCVMSLTADKTGSNSTDLDIACIGDFDLVTTPGSVSVTRKDRHLHEILICNNYKHDVTRHLLDTSNSYAVTRNEILLKKWLNIPDGVTTSRTAQWIAVSNHYDQNVLLYDGNLDLNENSDPDGILRGVFYPHGLRFTSDDRFIVVADAGAPYVHVYAKGETNWRGVRHPVLSVKVMSEEDFLRGHNTPEEGGPKGIDVDRTMSLLVTTCECQPLAFFDLEAILNKAKAAGTARTNGDARSETQRAWEVRYELAMVDKLKKVETQVADAKASLAEVNQRARQAEAKTVRAEARVALSKVDADKAKAQTRTAEARANRAEKQISALKNSHSWRLTAPARWAGASLKKIIGG